MRNIDETYKTELNFVDEFNLSRNGMIKEIEQEFNTKTSHTILVR